MRNSPPIRLAARGVLFDMDGTLVDSHAPVVRTWRAFADRFGLDLDDILSTSHGVPMIETVRRYAPAGLALPEVVVSIDDISRGKPAPDGYLRGAALLHVEPADTIVFEDAEAGISAGQAAGMMVVVVGEWESATTAALARIRDYEAVSVDVHDGKITLDLS